MDPKRVFVLHLLSRKIQGFLLAACCQQESGLLVFVLLRNWLCATISCPSKMSNFPNHSLSHWPPSLCLQFLPLVFIYNTRSYFWKSSDHPFRKLNKLPTVPTALLSWSSLCHDLPWICHGQYCNGFVWEKNIVIWKWMEQWLGDVHSHMWLISSGCIVLPVWSGGQLQKS